MARISKLKIQQLDGVYSDPIDFGVKAENVIFTENSKGSVLEDKINNKENKSSYEKYTMLASQWVGNRYSFESLYPFQSHDIEVSFADETTQEEMDAFLSALIVDNTTENVAIAKGEVPKIDIHIILKVVKK